MYPYSDIANSLPEGTSPWPIQKWPASPSFSPKSGRHDLVGHLRQSADLDEGGWELMVRSIQRVFWRIFSYRNYPRKKKKEKKCKFLTISGSDLKFLSFWCYKETNPSKLPGWWPKKLDLRDSKIHQQVCATLSRKFRPAGFLGSKPGWLDLSGVFIYSVFCLTHTKTLGVIRCHTSVLNHEMAA